MKNPRRTAPKRQAPPHWESEPRPVAGGRRHVGLCRSKQGIQLYVDYNQVPGQPAPRCRHCGGEYESTRPLRAR